MQLCYLTAFYLAAVGAARPSWAGFASAGRLLLSIALYGSWGVVLNDYVDRDLDAAAGKRTGIEDVPTWQVALLLALLPAIGFLLVPNPFSRPLAPILLASCYVLALAYSAPAGHRLKEKGIWGFAADVILEKSLPSLVLFASFDYLGVDAVIVAAFGASIGAFTLALHQVQDYESDLKEGVRTWAVNAGKEQVIRVYRRLFLPFFFASAALVFAMVIARTTAEGLVLLAIFILGGVLLAAMASRGLVARYDPGRWRGLAAPGAGLEVWYVFTFFASPVPAILGFSVVLRAPIFVPILAAVLLSQLTLFLGQYRWAIGKLALAIRR